MARAARSPILVAGVVTVLYALWIGWAHHIGHDWRDWADIGSNFLQKSSSSAPIGANASAASSSIGYDGQFFLYIAQDPHGAAPYIDDPGYRYGRILYPITARALAFGSQGLIPLALILVNLAAVALGTWAVAAWLRRRGTSSWLGLLFAAFPGVFYPVWRDLSETLAYSLVAVAILVFDSARGRRVAASSALFAAAALTRETALLFAFVWAAVLLAERRRRHAVFFALGAALPYLIWRYAFLGLWLGDIRTPASARPTIVPFAGIAQYFPWGGAELQAVLSVLVPGVFCVALSVYALRRGAREPAVWALLANATLFVVLLPAAAWEAASRASVGVVLAFLLSVPALSRVCSPARTWLWVPVVAWFMPWYVLLPAAFDAKW